MHQQINILDAIIISGFCLLIYVLIKTIIETKKQN